MARGVGFRLAVLAAAVGWVSAAGCSEGPGDLEAADPDSRIDAVRAAAREGSDAAVERLSKAARHDDILTAREACRGLGRMSRRSSARGLINVLAEDRRSEVRREAAIQLARKPQPETREALIRTLQTDPDPMVRATAAASLGQIGHPADIELLVAVAEREQNVLVQTAAVKAVESMVKMGFVYEPGAPPEERQKAVRRMRYWALRAAAARQSQQKEEGGRP